MTSGNLGFLIFIVEEKRCIVRKLSCPSDTEVLYLAPAVFKVCRVSRSYGIDVLIMLCPELFSLYHGRSHKSEDRTFPISVVSPYDEKTLFIHLPLPGTSCSLFLSLLLLIIICLCRCIPLIQRIILF